MECLKDRKTVEQVLKTEIDYRNKKISQFAIDKYYKANHKNLTRPIQTIHGLQNYSNMKLGDERMLLDQSFTHACFNPRFRSFEGDRGLSEERLVEKRRRDYEYALKMTAKADLDVIAKTIKAKLQQRTRAGPIQLRNTMKFFDRDGQGISLHEIRWAFAHMGMTFTDTQITALYAQLDKELTGDIRYQAFMDLLVDNDFTEITHSWLMPKHTDTAQSPGSAKDIADAAAFMEDLEKSLAMEMDETRRLFEWINRDDTGYLSHAELRILLLILGLKTKTGGLDEYLRAIDPRREGKVDFEKFWGWWSSSRQE